MEKLRRLGHIGFRSLADQGLDVVFGIAYDARNGSPWELSSLRINRSQTYPYLPVRDVRKGLRFHELTSDVPQTCFRFHILLTISTLFPK